MDNDRPLPGLRLDEEAAAEIFRFAERHGEKMPLIELKIGDGIEDDGRETLKGIFLVPRAGCIMDGKTVLHDQGIDIVVEGSVALLAGQELHFERRADMNHNPKLRNGGFFLRDGAEVVDRRMNRGA